MQSKFQSYSSIDNRTSKLISVFDKYNYTSDDKNWVLMEKIHGANLSFITDGKTIMTFKRSGLVDEKEKFYNSNYLAEKYKQDIIEIYNKSNKIDSAIINVQIFGEIFGGYYPNTLPVQGHGAVQKEVYYTTMNDFLIFDIKFNYEKEKDNHYIPHTLLLQIVEHLSIKSIPVEKTGTFESLINSNPIFITKIPTLYNLPDIDKNYAEGYVLKCDSKHLCNSIRPILKIKNNDKFGEIKSNYKKIDIQLTESEKETVETIFKNCKNYCTKNRLDNLISKIGNEKKFDIFGMFVSDVLKDYTKDLKKEEIPIFNKHKGIIKKRLNEYLHQIDFCKQN